VLVSVLNGRQERKEPAVSAFPFGMVFRVQSSKRPDQLCIIVRRRAQKGARFCREQGRSAALSAEL
jgi:hypothetical protein